MKNLVENIDDLFAQLKDEIEDFVDFLKGE